MRYCIGCRNEFRPSTATQLITSNCDKCQRHVDRAMKELGWKPNNKKVFEDKDLFTAGRPIPGLFWTQGKNKFRNLYRIKD